MKILCFSEFASSLFTYVAFICKLEWIDLTGVIISDIAYPLSQRSVKNHTQSSDQDKMPHRNWLLLPRWRSKGVTDHHWSLSEDVEEDMFNSVHRLKTHCPPTTDCYRALVACLLHFFILSNVSCVQILPNSMFSMFVANYNADAKCEAHEMNSLGDMRSTYRPTVWWSCSLDAYCVKQ